MKESVYVIRKANGVRFCVTKEHYEEYKDSYELEEPGKEEEIIEVLPESEIVVEKVKEVVKKTRGRKATVKE